MKILVPPLLLILALYAIEARHVSSTDGHAENQPTVTLDPDSDRFIVHFKNGQGRSSAHSAAKIFHANLGPQNAIAVTLSGEALEGLQNNPDIEYVETDYRRYPMTMRGNDSNGLFKQHKETVPYGIRMVQADQVSYDGSNPRTVCIIDTGYNLGHEGLPSTNVDGYSFHGGFPWNQDSYGHGTHIAGTIAAVSVNGVVGVAPGVKLFIVRVFDDRRTFVSSLVDAAYSCKAGGANVINMSLGGGGFSRAENTAFADLYTNHNILLVAAAGNFGNTPRGTVMQYPASYDSVVSVGAVDSNKELAIFSQRNDQVEMAAPGESVLSTVPMGTGDVQGNYAYESGTSMATPHVSGVAALIWSHNATKTASEVRAALQSTAEDLGVPGRDNEYGYGLVQAAAACSTLTGSSCTQFDPEPSGPSSGSATQQQSAAPSLSSAIPTNSWINAESLLVVASLFLLHTS